MSLVVVVTGSRDWTDEAVVIEHLAEFSHDCLLYVGNARGVDTIALKIWNGGPVRVFCPAYDLYGRRAPLLRNKEMLESAIGTGLPVVCIAFNLGTNGTNNTIRQARRLGIRVVEISKV